jgi:hypothetical protein
MNLTNYVKEKDVLTVWPMSKSTLIRARKNGLPFIRLGAYVCYKPEDLEEYFGKPRSWHPEGSKTKGGETK